MTQKRSSDHSFVVFVLCLLGVLLLLFYRSLDPAQILFSNDGPLGATSQRANEMPSALTCVWYDLNTVGNSGGAFVPDLSQILFWVLGPVCQAKFYAPFALLVLGMCAWFFYRQMRLSAPACILGGLATALSSGFFSAACWGVPAQPITVGLAFLAMGLLAVRTSPQRWVRVALAGLVVGIGVEEGADIGVMFSVFVAAFIIYQGLSDQLPPLNRVERWCLVFWAVVSSLGLGIGVLAWRGIPAWFVQSHTGQAIMAQVTGSRLLAFLAFTGVLWGGVLKDRSWANLACRGLLRVAVVASFALFLATQVVQVQLATAIQGVAGTQQDEQTKATRWDFATQWSLPKVETLNLFVPGLFGYRMDTPGGGNYWGAIGRDPAWDRYFQNGRQGPPPRGSLRFSGGGPYSGVLVSILGCWAALQAFRQGSVFASAQRRALWFWVGTVVICLLLAWGRFAPFYRWFYALPYVSTVRNPAKFLSPLIFALEVLFAYGIDGLWRNYMATAAVTSGDLSSRLRTWWARAVAFDRRWVVGCGAAVGASLLGWVLFGSARDRFIAYLTEMNLLERGPEESAALAQSVASFSTTQVGWFVLFFVLGAGLVALILSGALAGRRAKVGAVLLGLVLVVDLVRANQPWIVYWDYQLKYASNPVIDFLRQKPYEQRTAILPSGTLLDQLYRIEWAQHHFYYYNIPSLDIVQMPRTPEDWMAYETALHPDGTPSTICRVARRWQLTSTRYLLGPASYVAGLNQQLDPVLRRFRVAKAFEIAPKPGLMSASSLQDLTAVDNPNGQYAVIEFAGALPMASLYANWMANTNDAATLALLSSPEFDPARTVLVAGSLPPPASGLTNASAGTVEFASYTPAHIVLKAKADVPAVLLLNGKYDRDWKVTVDGQPASLLRCNYLMRGVQVAPGAHTVEFRFQPPIRGLYVTVAAMLTGVLLVGVLVIGQRRDDARQAVEKGPAPKPSKA